MEKFKNKLHKELVEFIHRDEKHPDYNVEIIKTTISDVREIYKGWTDKFGKLVGNIFNSIWNRKPNLKVPAVRRDKLAYAIRIGIGISSPNQIPASLIVSDSLKYMNYLNKDRGHLLFTICTKYSDRMWNLSELRKVLNAEKKDLEQSNSKGIDNSKKIALSIIEKIENYISETIISYNRDGVKNITDMYVSIEDLCDNVTEFNNILNNRKLSIEIKRESIWAHIKEILKLNNLLNKWLDVQKAFLSFWGYCHDIDGNSSYLDDVLQYDGMSTQYENDDFWNGNNSKKYPILSDCITEFNKKIADSGAIAVPMFLTSLSLSNTKFSERGELFFPRKDSDIFHLYTNLYNHKDDKNNHLVNRNFFENEVSLYKTIAQQPQWKTFMENVNNLASAYVNSVEDIGNLIHTNIKHSSYGGACILACAEIAKLKCDDRTSPQQIMVVVKEFTEKLYDRILEVCENGSYFIANKTIGDRFELTILHVYTDMVTVTNETPLSKEQICQLHYHQLVDTYGKDVERAFDTVSLKDESYNKPKVMTIDFRLVLSDRTAANIDLGQKEQTNGYYLGNTFLQQKGHNRSSHNGNHLIDNLEYWKWFAIENHKRVQANKQYFIESEQFKVISDATELLRIFS
jgi:hypothetical protein